MNVVEWASIINESLVTLQSIDFGYPIGPNVLRAPENTDVVTDALERAGVRNNALIREFYTLCDGISWPDVHVGYFINPIRRLVEQRPESDPIKVSGAHPCTVLPIGSTGGGELFVIARESGHILLLPLGPIRDGIYENADGRARVIAADFSAFLTRLLADLQAFISGEVDHIYATQSG